MKKSIYLSGIVLLNIFLFGSIFKIMHWPGANILIIIGLGLFACLFLPLAVYESYKNETREGLGAVYLTGFISLFISILGALFKINHWEGANFLLLIGIPGPFVLFLPAYLKYAMKNNAVSLKSFLGVMFLLLYIAVFTAMLAVKPIPPVH
jgi:hypothetical protein